MKLPFREFRFVGRRNQEKFDALARLSYVNRLNCDCERREHRIELGSLTVNEARSKGLEKNRGIVMKYHSIINHPEYGEMLNVTESAKYLGISRKHFRRIAPKPDFVQAGIYPFWARRILDILPKEDVFSYAAVLSNGRACGDYLISGIAHEDIAELRKDVLSALSQHQRWSNGLGCTPEKAILHLREHGVFIKFRSSQEVVVFCQGILSAISQRCYSR